jgi:hypothetical protein
MEVSSQLHGPAALSSASIGYEAGWASEPFLVDVEKNLSSTEIRTPGLWDGQPATSRYTDREIKWLDLR